MPLVLTLTEGVIPADKEAIAVQRIVESFLSHHGLAENAVMTPNVTSHVNVLPKGKTYAGGTPVDGAWIETKTPSFALADRAVQAAFFGDVTDILHELSEGALTRDRIWSDGVHAVDGTWNLGGKALTNAELGEAISAG